jgi:hypothetical protein
LTAADRQVLDMFHSLPQEAQDYARMILKIIVMHEQSVGRASATSLVSIEHNSGQVNLNNSNDVVNNTVDSNGQDK